MPKKATPAKLRSGGWGARVKGDVEEGELIEVVAKSGRTWRARVGHILWTGQDDRGDGGTVTLCETTRVPDAPGDTPPPADPGDDIPF